MTDAAKPRRPTTPRKNVRPATGPEQAAAPAVSHPDACPGCGAPWGPDAAGRCRYCKEQLSAASTATSSAPLCP